jgi:hypothetical protein
MDRKSLKLSAPSHQCPTCGALLKGVLPWKKGATIVVGGILLMLLGLAAYDGSRELPAIPQAVRFIAGIAFLSAVISYSVGRVIKSIEYKPFQPRM